MEEDLRSNNDKITEMRQSRGKGSTRQCYIYEEKESARRSTVAGTRKVSSVTEDRVLCMSQGKIGLRGRASETKYARIFVFQRNGKPSKNRVVCEAVNPQFTLQCATLWIQREFATPLVGLLGT